MANYYRVFIIAVAAAFTAAMPRHLIPESDGSGLVEKGCGNPADIVFILDSSSSIWEFDFYTQLAFVQDVVGAFQINQEQTRIGVMTFSDKPHRVFYLNYLDTEEDVKESIGQITQRIGGTHTAEALDFARTKMFSAKHGARQDIAQIAIVITDGQSYDQEYTVKEAQLLKEDGVHVFAIGVGNNVDKKELEAIASSPTDKYMFTVNNYKALQTIRDLLAIEACEVEKDNACTSNGPTDMAFAFAGKDAEDDERRNDGIDFIKSLVDEMEIGEDKIKVGLVPKDCAGVEGFDLNTFKTKQVLAEAIEDSITESSTSSTTLRFMREVSFTANGGARKESKKVGVVIVDGETDLKELRKAVVEARKMKEEHDSKIHVIGIGPNVDRKLLKMITGDDENIFMAANYADATERKMELLAKLCAGL